MKEKSLLLLECLRRNSRAKLTSISKKTHIPISTLFDLLKGLQNSVIKKNTVVLNFDEMGYRARAQVFLKVDNENKNRLLLFLQHHNNVNTLQKTNNGWDFIAEVVCKNIKELDTFLELLEKNYAVVSFNMHYLIEDIKKEGFSLLGPLSNLQ